MTADVSEFTYYGGPMDGEVYKIPCGGSPPAIMADREWGPGFYEKEYGAQRYLWRARLLQLPSADDRE
jgi:hypothetical protein